MREIFQKLKLPLMIIAALIAGFILYSSFVKKPAQTSILKPGTSAGSATSTPEKDFLPLLLQIQNVSLDQKIFIDPVFRALVDWSQDIKPESIGRQNPFNGQLLGTVDSRVESLGFTDESAPAAAPAAGARR